MKGKKALAILSATILSTLTLVSCSSDPEYGLSITAVAPAVDYEEAEAYADTLTIGEAALPVSVYAEMLIPISSDTETTDDQSYEDSVSDINQKSAEMMGSATLIKVTAQISGNEVDIILSDYENGKRLSSSDAFKPLDEVFTAEELASIDESLFISYELTDDDGNPTGEMTPPVGIDVSHVEEFAGFMAADQIVCHVVANTENLEHSKEYVLSLLD